MVSSEREAELERRLQHIHDRVQWMANAEARAAWVNGYGAKGEFWEEKKKLLDETDRILDELLGKAGT
jgi:hypothetical protein